MKRTTTPKTPRTTSPTKTPRKTKTTGNSAGPDRRETSDGSLVASGVSEAERWALAAAGGSLLLLGLTRRSWWGALTALLGGTLLYRCATAAPPARGVIESATEPASRRVPESESVIVDRPAEELYRFWRRLSNLPRFMRNLESVTELDEERSRWVERLEGGDPVAWDATIIQDREPEMLAWRSVPGQEIECAGSVWFEPTPKGGTRVKMARRKSRLEKGERDEAREDLRRFKQLMEAGEVTTTTGQTSARNPDF